MKTTCLFLLGLAFCWGLSSCTAQQPKPEEVIEIINRVNNYWQETPIRNMGALSGTMPPIIRETWRCSS